jgi:D-amino peptidase
VSGVRVLISVDMEGIAGVVDPQDVRPGEAEYERNRHLMTAEANAAVRGVLAYAPDAEVVVSDAHAQFRNVLPESLERSARLIRGKPKPGGMLAGVQHGVAAVLFIGYHGRAGTPHSVLSHTVNGGVIADVRINGTSYGEIGLNAALATHHGAVPVLVAGDDTVAAEAGAIVPGIHTVIVKWAHGAKAAESLHPEEACARIQAAVPVAMDELTSVQPPEFDGEVVLEVDVQKPALAEHALLVPGMSRPSGCTLRYVAPDYPTAYGLVSLISVLGSAGLS